MPTKVYCGRGFAGFSCESIQTYYENLDNYFSDHYIKCIIPISVMKVPTDYEFTKDIKSQPLLTNKVVAKQDIFLLERSDIVFIDFSDTVDVSIGAVCELAIAYEKKKHTVVCVSTNNIHYHAFIETFADYLSDNFEECLEYISRFS